MRGRNSMNLGSLSGTVFQDPGFGDTAPAKPAVSTAAAAVPPAAAVGGGIGIMVLALVGGVAWMAYSDKKARKRR